MDAADVDAFVDALINDLAMTPTPDDEAERTLFHLLHRPRRVVDDKSLLTVLAAAVAARNLLDHVISSATAAAERLRIPARRHLHSATDLLTALGVAPAAAARAVRVGRAAHTLPALTAAQRLGGIGIEFADAVGRGIVHIDKRTPLSEEDRAGVVRKLMVQATPADVAKKARAIAIDRAAALPAEQCTVPVAENADLNEMTLAHNDDGRLSATLDLDILTGEELRAALDPLCRPVPLPDGSPDPRPVDRRRADAFGQLLRTYLSHSARPMSGGVLPHVTLIRSAPSQPATSRGDRVDDLGFGGPVSPVTAELISCDCTRTSVTVDGAGVPLDVGRSERLFTPALRKGLAVRDGGCAFPGCGRPVSWCDAHHITPWALGGITSLDNGVLFCRRHHTVIHHSDWQVYLGSDRHPWFIPPREAAGPEPAHLRSHARRTMTDLPAAA
ncbi:HNH endonuclease [Mycolicibacterium cosmeticum]|uniref:13e12 repeat-containing protein n=1 Tax=Mycolicibacterium cosmeticum TaxID=258533 RepID=W9B5J5_MYCCO|nr:HNH endonuclease signature motif containing protein [Mycolicibacterium cosmeticum]TLH81789.1 HNH endonuclease [Mycolicibacterium cosmeticum]CDO10021.1 13e12 repeat-containing protein [Mycolicibacterium cosmeticum]